MIAEVVPFRRLPPHRGIFDYRVPPEIRLTEGQVLFVPFRNKKIAGIVAALKPDTASPIAPQLLKSVSGTLTKEPILAPWQQKFAAWISEIYGISRAQALLMLLPPIQTKKLHALPPLSFPKEKKSLAHGSPPVTMQRYRTSDERNALIARIKRSMPRGGGLLCVVPDRSYLDGLKILDPDVCITSASSMKTRFEAWVRVAQGARTTLGTRSALFAPLHALRHIILIDEENDGHKSWDAKPHYRSFDVAHALASFHGARLTVLSRFPRLELYTRATTVHTHDKQPSLETRTITVVDMREERRKGNFNFFSHAVLDAMRLTIEERKNVFLFLNRKGTATGVGCRDCGTNLLCPSCALPFIFYERERALRCHTCTMTTPVPLRCHTCNGILLHLRGTGVQGVEAALRRMYGARTSPAIVRIEANNASTHPLRAVQSPAIIIGTEAAVSGLNEGACALTAMLDADQLLRMPDFRNAEKLMAQCSRLRAATAHDGAFILQSHTPEHPVFRFIKTNDIMGFVRAEQEVRNRFGYPPYSYIVRITSADTTDEKARALADVFKKKIGSHVPMQTYALHPASIAGKKRMGILLKLPPTNWENLIRTLSPVVPYGWTIDPDPIDVLS